MAPELRVAIPAELSMVGELSRQVEEFGGAAGLPDGTVYVINLALDELITNCVEHGFAGVASPEIHITLRVADHAVILVMEDNGQPFDPTQETDADVTSALEDRPVGGLGLFLVKNFADRMAYAFVNGRNRLTLEHDLDSNLRQEPS